MTRVLAVADEVSEALLGETLRSLDPDVIVGCGDLPFDYLENLVSRTDRPLLYVPGNHDPDLSPRDAWLPLQFDSSGPGPAGCENVDGRVVEAGGLRICGLGGSIRYRAGPNQYTQSEMRLRALRLELRVRLRRIRVDVVLSHSPPHGCGDGDDPAHRGFAALNGLVRRLAPRVLIHGHVPRYGPGRPDLRLGPTLIVDAIPYRLLEL
jgi:Icc-related predicted phosphoesterase